MQSLFSVRHQAALLFLCCLLLAPFSALAKEARGGAIGSASHDGIDGTSTTLLVEEAGGPEGAPGTTIFNLSFADLYGDSNPVLLRGNQDSLSIPLPLPALWETTSIKLRIKLTPSLRLNNFSQLIVKANNQVIGQTPLNLDQQSLTMDVPVSTGRLKSGFNTITLEAVQHYTESCEYPEAPQLWTQINLLESGITITAKEKNIKPSLRNLSYFFDKASWQRGAQLRVLSSSNLDKDALSALGLIAQGIGQRYDFLPATISHEALDSNSDTLTEGASDERVTVVMATFDELESLGFTHSYPTDQGPVIAIKTLPGDIERYGLFIIGKNTGDLHKAASAFALLKAPWPNRDWVAIKQMKIPNQEKLEKRFSIPTAGRGAFPLRALGYRSTTFRGLNSQGTRLKIWNNSWQGRIQVRIHMSYASGMSEQSSLAIINNGVMHSQIPMNNPEGGVYEKYAVTIPAGAMKPGWNTLELKPYAYPQHSGGDCETWFSDNLAVTIYEDTTVQKFGGSEFLTTDLSLISGQGILFTADYLGSNIGFNLTDSDSGTLSSAMTLVAKLSQIYDRPLINSWFGIGDHEPSTFHYWIGPWDRLPADIRGNFESQLPDVIDFNVPVMQSSTYRVYEGWDWLAEKLEAMGLIRTPPASTTEVDLRVSSSFDGDTFAMSGQNSSQEPLILFTAKDSQTLRSGVESVIGYGLWGQLRGILTYWSPGDDVVSAVTAEDSPFSAFGLRGGVSIWVSQYPWLSLFVLLLIIGLLIVLTRKLLKQYQASKHPPT